MKRVKTKEQKVIIEARKVRVEVLKDVRIEVEEKSEMRLKHSSCLVQYMFALYFVSSLLHQKNIQNVLHCKSKDAIVCKNER